MWLLSWGQPYYVYTTWRNPALILTKLSYIFKCHVHGAKNTSIDEGAFKLSELFRTFPTELFSKYENVRSLDLKTVIELHTYIERKFLYISGGTYSLKSTPNDRLFEKFFMKILFTFRVFARNRRRNTFCILFWRLAWHSNPSFSSNKPR